MQRRRGLLAIVVGAISIMLVFSLAGGAMAKKKKKTFKVHANLTGQQEVPPADPDGTGTADFKLKTKKGKPNGKVCFDISFQNIEAPFVAHIHPGAVGVNGPPLITLFEDTAFTSPQEGCVKFARKTVKQVGKHPAQFYINIHNAEFEAGAIRGQLEKGPLASEGGSGDGGGDNKPGGGGTPPY